MNHRSVSQTSGQAGFEGAVTSLAEAERNRLAFTLTIVLGVGAMLATVAPMLALAALALGLMAVARHGMTRYRIRRGLYGTWASESDEILGLMIADGDALRN